MMPSPALRFTAWSASELALTGESDDDEQHLTQSHHQRYMHRRLNSDTENRNGNQNASNTSIDCSLGSSNDEVEDCPFASTYGCLNQPFQDRLTLYFDYEVYYTSLQPPLDFLQGSLAELVATSYDVAQDCSERRILQQAVPIAALSSSPRDEVNSQASCQAPVETAITETASCQVVHGKMSVWVPTTQNSLAITSQVLKEIRSIMSKDLLVVETPAGSIKRIIFMGQKGVDIEKSVSVPSGVSPGEPESIGGDQTLSAAAIASLSVLMFSAMLCILFAYNRGKKRQTQSHRKEETLEIQTSLPADITTKHMEHGWGDLETTLTSPHLTSPSTNNDLDQDRGYDDDDDDHVEIYKDMDELSYDVVEDRVREKPDKDDSPESMLVTIPSPVMTLESLIMNEDENNVLAVSHSSTSDEEYIEGISLSWNQPQSDKNSNALEIQPPPAMTNDD